MKKITMITLITALAVLTFNNGITKTKNTNNVKWLINLKSDSVIGFTEGLVVVTKNGKLGYIANPLSVQNQEQSLNNAGLFIGAVKSITENDLIVGGSDIAFKVHMGDKLCLYPDDKIIVLRATFPMMTVTKCKVISGNRNDVKPGMKVYKYSAGNMK